jgi:hypothetical protein
MIMSKQQVLPCMLKLTLHSKLDNENFILLSSMVLPGIRYINQKIILKHSNPIDLFKISRDIHCDNISVICETDTEHSSKHIVTCDKEALHINVQCGNQIFLFRLPYLLDDSSESSESSTSSPDSSKSSKMTDKDLEILQWCNRVQHTGQHAMDLEEAEIVLTNDLKTSKVRHSHTDAAWKQIQKLDQSYFAVGQKIQQYLLPLLMRHGYESILDVDKCQLINVKPGMQQMMQLDLMQAKADYTSCLGMTPTKSVQQKTGLYLLHACSGQDEHDKRAAIINKLLTVRAKLSMALAAWNYKKNHAKTVCENMCSHTTKTPTMPAQALLTSMTIKYVRQLYNAMLACDSAIRMNLYAGLGVPCSQHVANRHHNLYRSMFHRCMHKADHAHLMLQPAQSRFLGIIFENIADCLPTDYAACTKLKSIEANVFCVKHMLACMQMAQKRVNSTGSAYPYADTFDFTYSHRNESTLGVQQKVSRTICMTSAISTPRKHAALWLQRIMQMDCKHKFLHQNVMKKCIRIVKNALHSNNTQRTNPDMLCVYNLFSPDVQPLAALVLFGQEQPAVFEFMSRLNAPNFVLYNQVNKAVFTMNLLCRPL